VEICLNDFEGNESDDVSYWPKEGKRDWKDWIPTQKTVDGVSHMTWETSSDDGMFCIDFLARI
jgi:hypothetical protein